MGETQAMASMDDDTNESGDKQFQVRTDCSQNGLCNNHFLLLIIPERRTRSGGRGV